MGKLIWLARWAAVLVLPYLVLMTFLQVTRLLLPDGHLNPAFTVIALTSGCSVALLALISLGFLAPKSGSSTQYANFLTGSIVASYVLNDAFSLVLTVWPHVGFPLLFIAIGLSIAIWIRRKRRYEPL